jgi:hypothetical protein
MIFENTVTNPADFEGISFHSDSGLITIGKKIESKNQYLLFSSADLYACYQRSHTYLCVEISSRKIRLRRVLSWSFIYPTSQRVVGEL